MEKRDHGGGLDAAICRFGGSRENWIDLSTGINPSPYPIAQIAAHHWNSLPDKNAQQSLVKAARAFWKVPQGAAILAAPGASSLIARIPALAPAATVEIITPTYNEHAAAFSSAGWKVADKSMTSRPEARVLVHPNNPTGHWHSAKDINTPLTIIDESFCDIAPENSLIAQTAAPGRIVLKSFGKFWGLAGIRLGFAIGDPVLIAKLATFLGPWPVAGPALAIGTKALCDTQWAAKTRQNLLRDANRLDAIMKAAGATIDPDIGGGISLFRLYKVDDAAAWQAKLAQHHIWSRIFPYSKTMLRLGLPPIDGWTQIGNAL